MMMMMMIMMMMMMMMTGPEEPDEPVSVLAGGGGSGLPAVSSHQLFSSLCGSRGPRVRSGIHGQNQPLHDR